MVSNEVSIATYDRRPSAFRISVELSERGTEMLAILNHLFDEHQPTLNTRAADRLATPPHGS